MFKFTIQPDDGDEFEVAVGSRDIVVWEKTGPGRSITAVLNNLKATDMYAIAHIAARRQQLFTGSLDEFEKTCDIATESMFAVVEEEPDPTQPGPSVGPSSLSPSTPESPRSGGRSKKNG
jgi:hypothetical protein